MKRYAIMALKFLASVPIALVVGNMGARIFENGLWPLLFLPDRWLALLDFATVIVCQIAIFGALVWGWVFDR